VAFHYSSYGTFCVHSKSSIISTVVLPTTEIIEPEKLEIMRFLVGRFTPFSSGIEILPISFYYI
ncbi:MAG: hypothetical protein E6718_11575, partial [Streptococcus salivarius]|nr:hypothetical protein [Streptococcus salivarius]